jgi:hypothetical protein
MTAYPEDTPVLVRFPLPGQSSTDRDSWPWLRGTITAVCGEDEWQVIVTDPGWSRTALTPWPTGTPARLGPDDQHEP